MFQTHHRFLSLVFAVLLFSGDALAGPPASVEFPIEREPGASAFGRADSRFQRAYLWDADGDGSGWERCTAKDTPVSQCKVAGERIYADFVDDVNCAVRGCGNGRMAQSGTLLLERGVYVVAGCYKPGGTLDTTTPSTYADDATAEGDCPLLSEVHPNTRSGSHSVGQLSLAGWGGTIVGVGQDRKRTDTTALTSRGRGRVDGTYIVNDMGNVDNAWFDSANFHRSIHFGYLTQEGGTTQVGISAFTSNTTGDLGGYGQISASGAVTTSIQAQGISPWCVSSGETGLSLTSASQATGEVFDINSATTDSKFIFKAETWPTQTTKTSVSVVSPSTDGPYSQGSCPADSVEVIFRTASLEEDAGDNIALPSNIKEFDHSGVAGGSSATLYALRENYFDSNAQIRNVTFEPQDWWNEDGGDCSDTGLWDGEGTSDPSTDTDCDTSPMVGLWGWQGRTALKDVTFKYWHHYAVDGDSLPSQTVPGLDQVTFLYGNGQPIMDAGWGWSGERLTIGDSVFEGFVIAGFGAGRIFQDIRVYGSSFSSLVDLSLTRNDIWRGIRIEGSAMRSGLQLSCGAEGNTIEDVYITGRVVGNSQTSDNHQGIISLECDTVATPIQYNYFANLREDPPGAAVTTGGDYDEGAGQVLIRIRFTTDANAAAIGYNSFANLQGYNDVVPTIGTPASNHGEETCLISIEERSGDMVEEWTVLERQRILGSVVRGVYFCEHGGKGMWDDIVFPTGDTSFDTYHTNLSNTNAEF